MRTTVTLESDVEAIIRREMRERGVGFKQALNDVIRRADSGRGAIDFVTTPVSMGGTRVSLDASLTLAGQLEDDELSRRLQVGK
ncbi:hypothetical protein SAMN06309944_1718 [Micrococcales bacterium KH10]|nr:hypothetical protein SAMN06309944_1718 [Micrococcales bacterium KH10]